MGKFNIIIIYLTLFVFLNILIVEYIKYRELKKLNAKARDLAIDVERLKEYKEEKQYVCTVHLRLDEMDPSSNLLTYHDCLNVKTLHNGGLVIETINGNYLWNKFYSIYCEPQHEYIPEEEDTKLPRC